MNGAVSHEYNQFKTRKFLGFFLLTVPKLFVCYSFVCSYVSYCKWTALFCLCSTYIPSFDATG